MPKILLDGVEYNSEDMNEQQKALLSSLSFVDSQMKKLKHELSVFKQSKEIYARELKSLLTEDNK